MRVSLIIPTYNRGEVLCNTIAMALEQTHPDFEVIVVDQTASVDEKVRAYIDSLGERVEYHRLPTPNLPAARNAGVRASTGDIVVFIDDDVRIERDYVSRHARHFGDPSVGAVMGVTLGSADASVEEHVRNVRGVYGLSDETWDGVRSASWVLGGNTAYRRKAILEAGMSDERFEGSGWYEDADLAVRVRHLGYKLLLDSKIKMVHLALPSGGCGNRAMDGAENKEEEHLQLFAFYNIKNRHILGLREVCRALLYAYRQHSLNRTFLRKGMGEILRRQWMYAACIFRGLRRSLSERMPRETSRPVAG